MPNGGGSTPSLTPSPSRSPTPTLPVQPDHFYSPEGDAQPAPLSPESTGHAWLSPENDPLATKGIPVFKPSMEEFQDFEAYMMRIECWGMHSGIVKIIPPKEWSDALPSIRAQLANVRIKSPIEQHMLGHAGVFRQQNIERRKDMSVREWAELCAKDDYRAPAVDEVGLKAAGENATHIKRRNKRRAVTVSKEDEPTTKTELEDVADLDLPSMPEVHAPTPEITGEDDVEADDEEDVTESPSQARILRKRNFPTRAQREAALAKRAILDNAFLESFDPQKDWLPRNTSASDYTPSFCATLERRFWRNCGLGRPPWYGADTSGSLFTDETTPWNVSCLPSALSRLLPQSSAGLPGVNSPYLYFGMWRATFAWHVEDMDLFSINYIHYGAPKCWYAVPQMRAMQLENTLRSFFPQDGAKCRQFLRHKSFLASPTLLAQSGCKPNTLVQRAGEFVVTYPRGYHAGFNLGFNCAESVNFALESWLDIGRKAQACGCIGDSVRIDVDALLRDREEEILAATKVTSKPSSQKSRSEDKREAGTKLPRKRRVENARQPKAKKRKIKIQSTEAEAGPSVASEIRQKIMLKVPKDPGPYPCCLCVSRDTSGLLRVHDPPSAWSGCQNVTPKDGSGRAIWRAHEGCAVVVPETWVDEEADHTRQIEKMVYGVDVIVKDRWALKCSSCQKGRARVHGAPIQCTKGKCPKAFHISCAREGEDGRIQFTELREVEKEVLLSDAGQPIEHIGDAATKEAAISVDNLNDDDGSNAPPVIPEYVSCLQDNATPQENIVKTIRKIEYELLCPQHNPIVVAAKRASKFDRVKTDLLALPEMSRIKLRVSSGVFEVSLVSVNEERNTVEVIWDNGIKREFKWSSIVWGKAEGQTVGQKPSVAAPPHQQQLYHKLNVRFTPSNSSATAAAPQTISPSGFAASSSPNYSNRPSSNSRYMVYGSGQFRYGAWSNPYFPPGASSVDPSNSNAPGASAPASSYELQPTYSPYGASSAFPPKPLTWKPPTVQNQQGCSAPFLTATPIPGGQFSHALTHTVATSVASLPPRIDLSGSPVPPTVKGTGSETTGMSSDAKLSVSPPTSSGTAIPADLPPEVMQAMDELQRLSSLDPEELKEVLNSRPALVEAVRILISRQAVPATTDATRNDSI